MRVLRLLTLPSTLEADTMYVVSAEGSDECTVTFTGRDGLPRVQVAGAVTAEWGDIEGKPATFPPEAHGHVIGDVTGLTAALAGLQPAGSYASAAQGALADTALQPGADIPWDDVTGKPAFFSGSYEDLTDKPLGLLVRAPISIPATPPAKAFDVVHVDADVTASSLVIASLVPNQNNDADDLADTSVQLFAIPEAGQIRFRIRAKGWIGGPFTIKYGVA
jgi:hypothetical protein